MLGAVALLAVFGWQQYRLARRGGSPLFRGELFADRGFAVGSVLTVVFFGLFAASLLTVSVAAQSGLGFSALRTGLVLVPFAVGGAFGALTSPILMARWGSRALTVGLLLFTLAVAMMAATITPSAAGVDLGQLSGPVLIAGAGMGWFAAPLPAVMMAGVAERVTGSATGTVPTLQQLGTSLGVAAIGVLFFDRVARAADAGTTQAKSTLVERLTDSGVPAEQQARIVGGFGDCVETALTSATPKLAEHSCSAGDATIASAIDAATRVATGHTYLAAYSTVLWVVSGVAFALTALTLALPKMRSS
ncbi:MFS transporter [Nocardia sp. CA-129566]|uniref:MFS transporter n=1 Tax=Nocardia sp. CA-129566 TaxID=3239976 RepID=UPI003D98F34F